MICAIFLPVKIVDDGEEQKRIHQHLDHFLPRDVFDVRREVTRDGVNRERQHHPANRRPEQLRLGADPDPQRPQQHHADGESLDDEKCRRVHRAHRQRAENQDGEHERQNAALAKFVQCFTNSFSVRPK